MNVVSVGQATAFLLDGAVGIIPTDTVYGIVAKATNEEAVNRLYDIKHREQKPGTLIAANIKQLMDLGVQERYLLHAEKWWPGSLSIILSVDERFAYLHQGKGSLPIRVVPDGPVKTMLEQTGPLVTSSANTPGEKPADSADEAYRYFKELVDFYVDGGDRSGQPPSTIARMTDSGFEIIRQGAVVIPSFAISKPSTSHADKLN
jgi:L-threonylcarbamoyladenylate synthase